MPVTSAPPPPLATERFSGAGLRGEFVAAHRPADPVAEMARLVDPSAALATLHWGRNYLYRATLAAGSGPVPVVVKQFRGGRGLARLRERGRGSKARRSFDAARALFAAGLPTPEPLAVVESEEPGGASFYISRFLDGAFEARYLLRAARAGREKEEFPRVDFEAFLTDLGRLIRSLHEAGFWHRDLSVGNILLVPAAGGGHDLALLDLNRMRFPRKLSGLARSRDLSRLALTRPAHRELLLRGYWGDELAAHHRLLFRLRQGAFELKGRVRKPRKAAAELVRGLAPRRAHSHIPKPPQGAAARDRVAWDYLSDQPHQHAGRLQKLGVRLADAPSHLPKLLAVGLAAPRISRRYRELSRAQFQAAVPWPGAGLALRPCVENLEALLEAIQASRCRHLLLRLHPWQADHAAEEELARELAGRGHELSFALPQNRELVKAPERWRQAIAELAARFSPYGRTFQVGQAINRSKWGIWRYEEYVTLAVIAADELRRARADVQLLGPAVIDFEPYALAAVANLRREGFSLDGTASLLYVDRRGAPENRQLGFDTLAKATLVRAITDTARAVSGHACWITEVNWPLCEGPHSPAGKGVAVDEQSQASYLVRYFVPLLASGLVERVFWWQLVARGYGLAYLGEGDRLVLRPAFRALAHLEERLAGSVCRGRLEAPEGAFLFRFSHADGSETVVGWTTDGPANGHLPRPAEAAFGRDGEMLMSGEVEVELGAAPRYFVLARG